MRLPHQGTQIMQAVVGSTAYGLATQDSDIDTLGVYVARNDHVLGLDGPTVVSNTVVSNNPDRTIHEVGKFVGLALKCNPTILELLYAPTQQMSNKATDTLIENRSIFLSAKAVRAAYGGYATQQAKRLLSRNEQGKDGFNSDLRKRTAKHGRHCYRLLIMGEQLLSTGTLTLDVSHIRDRIFEVGDIAVEDPAEFNKIFEHKMKILDNIDPVIPKTNDRDAANKMLISIRKEFG